MTIKLLMVALGAVGVFSLRAAAPNLDDFTWYDAKDLTVEGLAFADTDDGTPYGRLPRSAKGCVTDPVWNMSHDATGVNVRFLTKGDGKGHRIMFKWEVAHPDAVDAFNGPVMMTGLTAYSRKDDGTWQFEAAPRYFFYGRGRPGEFAMNWPMGKAGMVYMPLRAQVKSFKVGVEKGCALAPLPRHPVSRRVVHYGTSIVHGGCVSRPGMSFASIEGRLADVEVINQGYSGAGRMEMGMCEQIASIDAALYILDCDWNMDVPMQKERYEPFVRELHKRRPNTPILLCGGCTQFDKPRAQEVFARGVYDKLKAEDPVLWKDLYFLSGVGMLPQDRECTFDFCHPNDYGSMQMGRVYADKIRQILDRTAAECSATALREKIVAKGLKIVGEDIWFGGSRIRFTFNGRTAWVVAPSVAPVKGLPWTWTMQWADAYVDRTGVPDLLKRGFHHVTLELFDTRMNEDGLAAAAAFQKFLVEDLGFAPKANLVGMSWGGFFSTRYAATYPQNVRKIYYDAPLMNFDGFHGDIGPWAKRVPADGKWSNDPNMPINLAAKVAAAKIPVLLLYGGQDQGVPPALNCELFMPRFKAAGGDIKSENRSLFGHHPHGVDPNKTAILVDFFER